MAFSTTLRRILTLNCEESTRLVSESLDRQLPRSDRVAVKLHALCCRSCRLFRRQMLFLRETIRCRTAAMTADTPDSGPSLTPEARERIIQALTRNQSEDSL